MKASSIISKNRIIPIAEFNNKYDAINTCKSILAGGINVVEITFRTTAAPKLIETVRRELPDMLVGAGTVITLDQCKEAVKNGAEFIVSPGLNNDVISWCLNNNIEVYPGAVTPTEITEVIVKYGLNTIKFFPEKLYGGISGMKALSSPFRDIKFIPTGGINANNLEEYLKQPFVFAVGGSWLCSSRTTSERQFKDIENVCREACCIVKKVRNVK